MILIGNIIMKRNIEHEIHHIFFVYFLGYGHSCPTTSKLIKVD